VQAPFFCVITLLATTLRGNLSRAVGEGLPKVREFWWDLCSSVVEGADARFISCFTSKPHRAQPRDEEAKVKRGGCGQDILIPSRASSAEKPAGNPCTPDTTVNAIRCNAVSSPRVRSLAAHTEKHLDELGVNALDEKLTADKLTD
jgi:hypothetical protein